MSMYSDIDWDQKRDEEACKQNSASVSANAKRPWRLGRV